MQIHNQGWDTDNYRLNCELFARKCSQFDSNVGGKLNLGSSFNVLTQLGAFISAERVKSWRGEQKETPQKEKMITRISRRQASPNSASGKK
jgi:hypothetical protein